jgi:hypothetical protein
MKMKGKAELYSKYKLSAKESKESNKNITEARSLTHSDSSFLT